jgi:hypothetical protein
MENQPSSQKEDYAMQLSELSSHGLPWVEYFNKRSDLIEKRAEQSEKKEIIFPREELEQIRQVNLWLKKILSELKQKQTENPQKYKDENYEKRVLKLIMNDLDKLDLWKCKFSTSNNASREDNIEPKETDSIYYMTPSGASLRFKMIMFDKNNGYMEEYGIHYVKQAFATFIYFTDGLSGSDMPIVGNNHVKEIFDDNFLALINQKTPIEKSYSTNITSLTDKYGLWEASAPLDSERHPGSLVNKIFFIRNKAEHK